MKKLILCSLAVALIALSTPEIPKAQEITGGVVKYKQTIKYDFDKVLNANGDAAPRMLNFLAGLPKEGTKSKVLYFSDNAARYQLDDSKEAAPPPRGVARAFGAMANRAAPKAVSEIIFYDFKKNELTNQIMFMTRNFLVTDKIQKKAWKLSNKISKVLDYTCMSAELKIKDKTITAWYTPEIPISAGPDEYSGLPGLVLAVQIDEEYAYVATSVELNTPSSSQLSKPTKGEKFDQKGFDKVVAEKVKEWKETQAKRRKR